MLPWSAELAGTLNEHVITSELLRDNPLGDPYERPLWVYTPPGYAAGTAAGTRPSTSSRASPGASPCGTTGRRSGSRSPRRRTPCSRPARLRPPSWCTSDAWTSYGGSQFVDSAGTGRYHSYLCEEIVPWVDARYQTAADRDHRAIMGKSSGGFGAMITPMLRPDLFGALASHAGDSLYEHCYLRDFGNAVRALRGYDGDIWRWWADFSSRVPFTSPADGDLLGILGVAAAFSANEDGTIDLPFDTRTAAVRPQVWERWLNWDPVRMAPAVRQRAAVAAGDLAGRRNARRFLPRPRRRGVQGAAQMAGVPDDVIRFELFDATHAASTTGTRCH